MGKNCRSCSHASCGGPNANSDVCDSCRHEPNTGWGGYTDNSKTDNNSWWSNNDDDDD